MEIQFRCNNIAEFDSAKGRYVHCTQMLSAESQHVGLKVRCPKCKQTTTVPNLSMAVVGATNGQPAVSAVAAPTEEAPEPESRLEYSRFDRKVRCPKCGSLLDDDKRCTACRYAMPVVMPRQIPLAKIDVKPAGFQLWIMSIMSDGINPRVLEAAAHSLFAMTMVLGVLAAIGLGGANFPLALAFIGIVTGFYALIVIKTKQLARKPAVPVPFYLKPFWNLILILARSMDWQRYDSMLDGRKIIDVRGENFGDRELLALPDLHVCEVLDAESTDVTDHGLAHMHGLKYLRCLVLRRTHVTPEGVFRLQQAIPKCWIWY